MLNLSIFGWSLLYLVIVRLMRFIGLSKQCKEGKWISRIRSRPDSRRNRRKSFILGSLSQMNTVAFYGLPYFSWRCNCRSSVAAGTLYNMPWLSNVVLFPLRCHVFAIIVNNGHFQAQIAALLVQTFNVGSRRPFIQRFSLRKWAWCGL